MTSPRSVRKLYVVADPQSGHVRVEPAPYIDPVSAGRVAGTVVTFVLGALSALAIVFVLNLVGHGG